MDRKRRDLIMRIGRWTIAAPAGLIATIGLAQVHSVPPPRLPNVDQDATPENLPPPDPKLALQRSQKQIKDDVEKLFTLAGKLKEQVEKTDSTAVLSLSFVESTKQIESLAKHIRNLALG